MNGRLTRHFAFAAAALFAVLPSGASAQSRYRVLVPDFFALSGANRGWGKDVAAELRARLDKLGTHAPIPEKELKEQLTKYKMKMEELDCAKTQQLASQIGANLALCASYTGTGPDSYELSGVEFWDMQLGEPLEVESKAVAGKDSKVQAADHVYQAFDRMVQLARSQQFCADYAGSQQWDNAIDNCVKALELNPGAVTTRLRLANVYFEQGKIATDDASKNGMNQKALDEVKKILAVNEFHETALQLAGILSINLGQPEEGRKYFSKYLEVNPGADEIRLKIAYDMQQAGDPEGAMQFIKVGIDKAPDNAALLEFYASYGFAAAAKRDQAKAGTPEAVALYKQVADALRKVKEIRGSAVTAPSLRTLVVSLNLAGDPVAAEAEAKSALEQFPTDGAIWAQMADAQQKQGRVDDAVATMEKLKGIQADYPNLRIRQANWLITAGRIDDAIPFLKKAVEDGTDPNTAANMVFSDANANGIVKKNWNYALKGVLAAKTFDVNAEMKAQLDFWHGWSIYQQAVILHTPKAGDPNSANMASAKVVKPMFEQAKALFAAGRAAGAKLGIDMAAMTKSIDSYLEIEDILIRRGR